MKILLKFLYKVSPRKYREVLAEDFLRDIPKEVSEPAFNLLAEKKRVLDRYFVYQGWLLARRDFGKHTDFTLGSLATLKSLMILIGARGITKDTEEHPTLGEVRPASDLKKDLEGVEKFKKGRKLST